MLMVEVMEWRLATTGGGNVAKAEYSGNCQGDGV